IDVALLGGAQIDRHGNLNTTVIGDYSRPSVRLPGSGGACEIAINARRVLYIMRLSKRAFVSRLDFCTSPGHLPGKAADIGTEGPKGVITDMALFDFNNEERELQLVLLHPGVHLEAVQASIGWEVRLAAEVGETAAPTEAELTLLRGELDPMGLYR
ncbi:MAG TPA: CoA-transferase, partial [Chloroflexia bacterium]|nr:CoA-transferase [Chloroflexia bacterium]